MSRSSNGEAGFTIVELAVVMVIMTSTLAAVIGVLIAHTNAEQRTRAVLDTQEEARSALRELANDLRAANPLLAPPAGHDPATNVEVKLQLDATTTIVRWNVDAAAGLLSRSVLDEPGGIPVATTYRITGVDSGDFPLFRYYDASGDELDAANASNGDIATCAARVEVVLVVDAAGPAGRIQLRSGVDIRNRPRGIPC